MLDLGLDERTQRAVARVTALVADAGGRAMAVGGVVRDALHAATSGQPVRGKDVDIEVYGIEPGELRVLLDGPFAVDLVGEQFAVLKLLGLDIDVSIPRREQKAGVGHRGFSVASDPHMTPAEAAARRDFTINAVALDLHTGEVIDPTGGADDLAAGILRHVGPQFAEDPLRVLRAAQFVARFGLTVDPDTATLCRSLRDQVATLPTERVWEETRKLLLRGVRPGDGFHFLNDVGWLELVHPELAATKGVEQDPTWHPEGDVFVHSCHALDYWAGNLRYDDDDDLIVAVAIAAHDFGKATTTEHRDGRWRAHGHEAAGIDPARTWIAERLGQVRLFEQVAPLIEHHLAPVQLHAAGAGQSAVRRLATKVRIDLLVRVSWADQGGRPPLDPGDFPAGQWLTEQAAHAGVARSGPEPLVGGRHLIAELGMEPGPHFGPLLAAAFEAQIEGRIASAAEGVDLIRDLLDAQ